MIQFVPNRPNGALFDAEGRIAYRFAGLNTSQAITIPAFIDPSQGVTYVDTTRPGTDAGLTIEVGLGSELPDPAAPDDQVALARETDEFIADKA